jgi:DNA polymerase I-like protein with 3'-5' exonuclease and polymerase domains
MNLSNVYVNDIETDGLWARKIHCLCYRRLGTDDVVALTSPDQIKKFITTPGIILVGHNYVKYDMPTMERLLGLDSKSRGLIADTLGLSWVLQPDRKVHGLEQYGEEFGVPKPTITDWSGLSVEEYVHRCTEDTKINYTLWVDQWNHLLELYDGNIPMIEAFIRYIQYKLTVVSEQETIGVKLDIRKCQEMINKLSEEKQEKLIALTAAMPRVKIYDMKKPPAKPLKKDGSLSSDGMKWQAFLEAHNLPSDYSEPVKYVKGIEDPNPNSVIQKKDWLYSLGWTPEHIRYERDKKTGEVKEIPQIKNKDQDKEGEVCDSIKRLFEKEPALEILEGLTIITHRIGVFEGFLRDQRNGRLHAGNSGFTNTMRLKHVVVVNLPKVTKRYGADIRGALIADEGMMMCGSDLSNIESITRNHYIYPYDAEYVKEMDKPGFDSHLDIAKLAGFLTEEQVQMHISGVKKFSEERNKGKTVNFAAVYGVGAPTLSRNSGLPIDLCARLLETYWQRNWAVKAVAESCYVKTVRGQMWLYNPISKFYYSLRAEKDRFSTLNQSSAVYVFDVWTSFLRKRGIKSCLQMHDETLFNFVPEDQYRYDKPNGHFGYSNIDEIVKWAIDQTNALLKLNVTIGCSADYGTTYAECH